MKLKRGKLNYKLPKDVYSIECVSISRGQLNESIYRLPPDYAIVKHIAGSPIYFIIKNGEINFQPVPDKAYKVIIRYTTIKEV